MPIKAVLSTSDSWPHVGGIRYDMAQSLPIDILDLNQSPLDRMLRAPHTLDPDPLQTSLYASDTLLINPDHTLYDPELMQEVRQAVDREHLAVDTVFAMHQKPVPWSDAVALIGKAVAAAPLSGT